jgi:hypothetical protein
MKLVHLDFVICFKIKKKSLLIIKISNLFFFYSYLTHKCFRISLDCPFFLFDSKSNIFFTSPSHLQSREIYLVENLSFSLVTHLIVSNYKRHFIEYFAYMEILTVYGLCRNNLVRNRDVTDLSNSVPVLWSSIE